jgi:hypothetical protein
MAAQPFRIDVRFCIKFRFDVTILPECLAHKWEIINFFKAVNSGSM